MFICYVKGAAIPSSPFLFSLKQYKKFLAFSICSIQSFSK
jgi:hypothetical protein